VAARGARAQSPVPVIGLLRSTPAAPFAHLVDALRQGLADEGFIEGRNVVIEQRHADNQLDRLPGLAAELVRHQVSAIVGNVVAVEAARAATATIPIVFVTGEDPVKGGLVASLNRPEANLTGVTFFGGSQLDAKRLELLRDLIPKAAVFAVLGDVNYPAALRVFRWQQRLPKSRKHATCDAPTELMGTPPCSLGCGLMRR
jgi:putative tryptophan/tyrosine transport system substrate-binding protein